MKEIERRFELDDVPLDVEIIQHKIITQTFLSVAGKEMVRVRRTISETEESYELTIKIGKGLEREETNIPITQETFDNLYKISNHEPTNKTRLMTNINGNIVEIDRFFDDPTLIVAEVEFESLEEAKSFIPPAFFGREVTKKSVEIDREIWLTKNKLCVENDR